MTRKRTLPLVFTLAALAGVGVYQYSSAQVTPPGDDQGAPRQQGRFPGFGGGGFGGGGVQMAVASNALFILRGNTLYRVNAQTLKVEVTGALPQPEGGAGFRGGQGGPNFRGGQPGGAPPPPQGGQGGNQNF